LTVDRRMAGNVAHSTFERNNTESLYNSRFKICVNKQCKHVREITR